MFQGHHLPVPPPVAPSLGTHAALASLPPPLLLLIPPPRSGVALLCNIPLCILPARDLLFLLAAMASTGPGAGAGEGTVNALTAIDAALVELDDGVDDGASEDKPAADEPTKAVSSSSNSTGSSSEATPLRSKGPGHGATTQADAEAGATAGFAGAEANSLEGSVSGHVLLTLGILLLVFVGATACQGVSPASPREL